jgi:4-hydroxy-2-oxoheptanedioate aldolase
MVNTPTDAEALIRAGHYAPRGQRSVGSTQGMMAYGPSYIQDANGVVITLAMIETRKALDGVEAIARTPGLTCLYIGPSDLAQLLGYPIQLDPTGARSSPRSRVSLGPPRPPASRPGCTA